MPRDVITPVAGAINDKTAQGAGVAINVTNGGSIALAGVSDNVVLLIDHTTVSAKNLTIKAGVNPPAFRAGLGDLVVAMTLSAKLWFFLESARFIQADGTIWIDFEAGATGTVFAIRLPGDFL